MLAVDSLIQARFWGYDDKDDVAAGLDVGPDEGGPGRVAIHTVALG